MSGKVWDEPAEQLTVEDVKVAVNQLRSQNAPGFGWPKVLRWGTWTDAYPRLRGRLPDCPRDEIVAMHFDGSLERTGHR